MSTVNIIYNAVVIFALFMGAEDHATVQYCSISNTKWGTPGLGIHSFQKNATFLRSFKFFIKERGVLCILLCSL